MPKLTLVRESHLIVFTKGKIAQQTVSITTDKVQLRFGVTAEIEASHAHRPSEIRPSQLEHTGLLV